MNIILASTSSYRKNLLSKLGLEFKCINPNLDEEELKLQLIKQGRSPIEVAETLSLEKALSIFNHHIDNSVIISGDQLVNYENHILGKPHTYENAVLQLNLLNGKTHQLITAVTLKTSKKTLNFQHITQLRMKHLTLDEINNYVKKDNPLDCSGSYKIEQSGIVLFESINCDDFTAIQGIPMIWLSNRLKEIGYEFFRQ